MIEIEVIDKFCFLYWLGRKRGIMFLGFQWEEVTAFVLILICFVVSKYFLFKGRK